MKTIRQFIGNGGHRRKYGQNEIIDMSSELTLSMEELIWIPLKADECVGLLNFSQ